ncbi:MAG: right-handed parallel beta-helix repeat-containing protein, partial [Verrucomicrobia bacterium]|nr:right-handed parallel beta-helix repeat-containing protein [Verrucomicrobiota bacterium]
MKMKVAWFVVGVLGAQLACPAAEPDVARQADFYVSPRGSDAWSGTLSGPDAQGSDGPFATLQRARDAVRKLKQSKATDIVVLIRGGTYRLDKTVVFGVEDSGEGEATITYRAYPGEIPVFSSGRPIAGWRQVSGELPGLPAQAQGKVRVADVSGSFKTLYDGEGMLPRARSAGFIPLHGDRSKKNVLRFPVGKLKNWSNLKDVEIVVRPLHAWILNVLPLASVDEQAGIATTTIEATYAMNPLQFLKGTPSCWVENILEELDQPGEWVLDTKEGKLYLWPRSETPVLVPQLLELLRVEGEIDMEGPVDRPVRNLRFQGLTFMHGERYTVEEGDAGLQHDWDMLDKANALVRFRGTANCAIEQCHFAHSGSGAIRVDLFGRENEIVGNHIEQMGGGGILLCGYGPGTKDVNRKNLVYNNHVHHVGRIYLHSPGIFLWQSGENRVANNLIHHTPYSAMILSGCLTQVFGWPEGRELARTIRWHEVGGKPSALTDGQVLRFKHSRDNLIEYNEIHHAMELLGDGNGIYVRGAGANNVIRRNYVHHLVAPMQMQAAIRTDGGQRDTLIAENLIYKCTAQGIMLKLNNRAENNIVADIIAPPRGNYLAV